MARGGLRYLRYGFGALGSVGLVCLALLLSAVPLGFSPDFLPGPFLALALVFYWTTRNPRALAAPPVFLFGLGLDIAGAGPLGFWALFLLSGHALALTQRRLLTSQGFAVRWCGAGLLAGVLAAAIWAISSYYAGFMLPAGGIAANAAFGAAIYPLIAGLCAWAAAERGFGQGYAFRM